MTNISCGPEISYCIKSYRTYSYFPLSPQMLLRKKSKHSARFQMGSTFCIKPIDQTSKRTVVNTVKCYTNSPTLLSRLRQVFFTHSKEFVYSSQPSSFPLLKLSTCPKVMPSFCSSWGHSVSTIEDNSEGPSLQRAGLYFFPCPCSLCYMCS